MPSNVTSLQQIYNAIAPTTEIGALTGEDSEERGFTRQGPNIWTGRMRKCLRVK